MSGFEIATFHPCVCLLYRLDIGVQPCLTEHGMRAQFEKFCVDFSHVRCTRQYAKTYGSNHRYQCILVELWYCLYFFFHLLNFQLSLTRWRILFLGFFRTFLRLDYTYLVLTFQLLTPQTGPRKAGLLIAPKLVSG